MVMRLCSSVTQCSRFFSGFSKEPSASDFGSLDTAIVGKLPMDRGMLSGSDGIERDSFVGGISRARPTPVRETPCPAQCPWLTP